MRSERLRREVIASYFFPAIFGEDGSIPFATPSAIKKRDEFREGWLINHPRVKGEEPVVALGPGSKNGKKGFFVRKEIVYLPDTRK